MTQHWDSLHIVNELFTCSANRYIVEQAPWAGIHPSSGLGAIGVPSARSTVCTVLQSCNVYKRRAGPRLTPRAVAALQTSQPTKQPSKRTARAPVPPQCAALPPHPQSAGRPSPWAHRCGPAPQQCLLLVYRYRDFNPRSPPATHLHEIAVVAPCRRNVLRGLQRPAEVRGVERIKGQGRKRGCQLEGGTPHTCQATPQGWQNSSKAPSFCVVSSR